VLIMITRVNLCRSESLPIHSILVYGAPLRSAHNLSEG
jgi:hypothetical protein